ncbi:glycosyltransferase [Oxynema sp. CENA135]|uniref:glycosyltransferase n=1 Tax=Oxynema sp. CENA135 TaxID=984206 RepID=UPI0019098920|nr:glycosyltransferase [Oxynema sp. CENA135]MBK4730634.1 glycosyltransferase [Oxynema sp. CENA135]
MNLKYKKYKFLFLGCSSIQTNASLFRALLARYLVEYGHEVHILLEDDPANRQWVAKNLPGVYEHYQSRYASWQDLKSYLVERRQLIDTIQPDFVHLLAIGWKNLFTIPLKTHKISSPTYIADFDELYSAKASSLWQKLLYRYIENRALQLSNRVICASKFLVNYFSKTHKGSQKILYLPYAYSQNFFNNGEIEIQKVKTEYKFRKILVYMGTLSKEYQSHQVLELAERMQSKRDQIVFLLIGGGSELKLTKEWVLEKCLEDFVYVVGYLPPNEIMYSHLMAADVLLFPIQNSIPNQARCPNKTFQYIGANRPIVTNRVGEVEEALGNYGYYYDFNNLESFEKAVLSALSDSESYDASSLLPLHTWEKRCLDYLKWLSET